MTKIIPKGTVIKLNGIPLELCADTKVECSKGNYRLLYSQSAHSLLNPTQAPSPDSLATSNSSVASM